jgi:hypothetical protein
MVIPWCRPTSTISGLRTAIVATWSIDTVFSLSVNAYVGTPPIRRNVVSKQDTMVGMVLSSTGITTRNRDHASHAHHKLVRRPLIRGPSPQSHCSHNPGSVIHGRNTLRSPKTSSVLVRHCTHDDVDAVHLRLMVPRQDDRPCCCD